MEDLVRRKISHYLVQNVDQVAPRLAFIAHTLKLGFGVAQCSSQGLDFVNRVFFQTGVPRWSLLVVGADLDFARWNCRIVPVRLGIVLRYYAGYRGQYISFIEMDESDPLSDTTRDADLRHRGTDDYAVPGDQHDLIFRKHFHHSHHVTGLLGAVDGDDPLPAAPLHTIVVDVRALAEPFLGDHENRRVALDDDHSDERIAFAELDSLHSGRVAAHLAYVLLMESHGKPVFRREDDVVRSARHLNVDQSITRLDLDCLDAGLTNVRVLRESALLDRSFSRTEEKELGVAELANRDHRLDARIRVHVDQIDDRLALCRAPRLRNLVDLEPEAAAVVGEAKDVVVRRADEQPLDEILVLEPLTAQPAASAPLLSIRRDRRALDVARMGDGDDHVLFGNQVLDREFAFVASDLGAPLVAEPLGDFLELFAHDLHPARTRRENLPQLLHERSHFLELGLELVALQARQLRASHVQNRLGLTLAELDPLLKLPACGGGVGRGPDQLDHCVDIVDGDLEALEDV